MFSASRRAIWLLLAASLRLSAQPAAILGEPPVAEWAEVTDPKADRSAASESFAGTWIDTSNRAAVRDAYLNQYLPILNTATGWNGNGGTCTAGDTTQAYKDAVLTSVNYFRGMGGVTPLTGIHGVNSAKSQQAALVFSVNRQISHYLDQPPASSWSCVTADATQAARNSNICLYSWNSADPGCVEAYMEDQGANNTAVGHRRWILNPPTQQMGTGDVPANGSYWKGNALWVIGLGGGSTATRDGFVSWPPKGHVPKQMVFARWSFSYSGANFSSATVTMTRGGQGVSTTLEPIANGYGLNTLVWVVPASFLTEVGNVTNDLPVNVAVNNVIIGGSPQNFSYTVTIIDPDNAGGGGGTVPVTVTTNPGGLNLTVDGVTAPTPQTYNWAAGNHTLDAPSPQSSTNTRNTFASWAHGGGQFQNIAAPSSATTYTANFQTAYLLTTSVSPGGGGTITRNPSSGDGFYNKDTPVQVTAQANAGYTFSGFSGSLTGLPNQQTVTMSGPKSVTANFTTSAVSFTVTTNPPGLNVTVDGVTAQSPQTFSWTPGTQHTLTATATINGAPGTRYQFASWSPIGGAASQSINAPGVSTTYTANYTTQYLLTRTANPANGGTLTATPASGDGYYNANTQVQLNAQAAAGFTFSGFTGDLTGTANPQSVVMSVARTVAAGFGALGAVSVTVATVPSGLAVVVDGVTRVAPAILQWTPGSQHTLDIPASQTANGARFLFSNWSQGGARTQTLTAPSAATAYTANHAVQYLLTRSISPSNGGTLTASPDSIDGYYNDGTPVTLAAAANAGFQFSGFSGSLSGSGTPQNLTMSAPQTVTASFQLSNPTPGGSNGPFRFIAVTPCRVADTRAGQGKTGAFGPPSLPAGQTREMPIPQSTCGIPSGARAYSLNVTVVPSEGLGYLTVWPAGLAKPLVSTLNSFDGRIVANAAIVPAGVNGSINVFVSNRTDVIVDINGYFAP
ncbi:MAG: InlB B-repeat-containing protein [Bryobacteraceae bacterium]